MTRRVLLVVAHLNFLKTRHLHGEALAKAAKDLGAAGINIENFYYSALEKEKETNMYIQVSEKDFSKAVEVLQNI